MYQICDYISINEWSAGMITNTTLIFCKEINPDNIFAEPLK